MKKPRASPRTVGSRRMTSGMEVVMGFKAARMITDSLVAGRWSRFAGRCSLVAVRWLRSRAWPRGGAPVLVLARDRDAAADALAHGARGALLRTAAPRRIRAALHAVADGLVAIDDDIADSVLPHTRTAVELIEPLTAREMEVLH